MKFKKLFVLLAACVFATFALAGCGGSNSASSGSGSGAKVLKVGSSIDFAPFEFQDEGQKDYQGFDMDLIRAIGKEMGYEVEVQNIGFDGLIPMGELADKRIERADEAVHVGDIVRVKILRIDTKRKRISLSITKARD